MLLLIIYFFKKSKKSYDQLITLIKKDFKTALKIVENLSDLKLKQELILEGETDLAQDTYQHIKDILINDSFLKELFQEVFAAENEAKKRAALTLVKINTAQAIDYAISLLYDQDQELRKDLIKALSDLENPKITPTFINYLEFCQESLTLKRLKKAILNRGSQNLTQLLDLLKNSEGATLILIINLLGEINEQKVISPLINILLNHQKSDVKIAAIKALQNYQNDEVFKALLYLNDDQNCHIRAQVAKALAKFDNQKKIPYLYELLKDDSGIVRNNAVETLFKLGESGIKYLVLAEEQGLATNEINRILKSIDTSKLIKIVKETYKDIENNKKISKLQIKEK